MMPEDRRWQVYWGEKLCYDCNQACGCSLPVAAKPCPHCSKGWHRCIVKNCKSPFSHCTAGHDYSLGKHTRKRGELVFLVEYKACAHGGLRPKSCQLVCSHHCVSTLAAQCPEGSSEHLHAPFRNLRVRTNRRPTTQLLEPYPHLFCSRVARSLLITAGERNWVFFLELCCGCGRLSAAVRK